MTVPKGTPSCLKQLPQPSTPMKDTRNSIRTIFSPRLCPATSGTQGGLAHKKLENLGTTASSPGPFVRCHNRQIPTVGWANQLVCQARNEVNHASWQGRPAGFSYCPPAQRSANAPWTKGRKGSHPLSMKKPCEAWQTRWQSSKEGTIPSGFQKLIKRRFWYTLFLAIENENRPFFQMCFRRINQYLICDGYS